MTTQSKKYLADVPPLTNHPYEWAWNMHPKDRMSMVIYHWGQPVMSIFLGEAMESAGRNNVLKHVVECDNSYWLKQWQQEKNAVIMEALTRDYASSE